MGPAWQINDNPMLVELTMRFTELPTPCFIVDEKRLVQNLAVLRGVAERTGARSCSRKRRFPCFPVYPLLREYLAGTTASGLYEARLGHEEFGGETHVYSPAYAEGEFQELAALCRPYCVQLLQPVEGVRQPCPRSGQELRPASQPRMLDPACRARDVRSLRPVSRLGITLENFSPTC